MSWGRKWLVDFNIGKTQLVLFDQSSNTGAIDVKMDSSVLEEKASFKMLGLFFSFKLNWGSHIICIAETVSKKIGVLICSTKFLSPEAALYLWNTVAMCGLVLNTVAMSGVFAVYLKIPSHSQRLLLGIVR